MPQSFRRGAGRVLPAALGRALLAAALLATASGAVASCAGPTASAPDDLPSAVLALAPAADPLAPAFASPARHRGAADEGTGDPAARLALTTRVMRAVVASADPAALRASALIDLRWGAPDARRARRAVRALATAARLSARPAPALTDLAAARLVEHALGQAPDAVLEALDASERALRHDSTSEAARFDRLLALDAIGFGALAASDARAFLRTAPADRARPTSGGSRPGCPWVIGPRPSGWRPMRPRSGRWTPR